MFIFYTNCNRDISISKHICIPMILALSPKYGLGAWRLDRYTSKLGCQLSDIELLVLVPNVSVYKLESTLIGSHFSISRLLSSNNYILFSFLFVFYFFTFFSLFWLSSTINYSAHTSTTTFFLATIVQWSS